MPSSTNPTAWSSQGARASGELVRHPDAADQHQALRRSSDADTLAAFITRKPRDPLDSAHRVDFRYEPAMAPGADYLRVALGAPLRADGHAGLQDPARGRAARFPGAHSRPHVLRLYPRLSTARFAMDAYLAGTGRDKRGFTVDGGERGVVERSAMRHYLAIEAYLASLSAPTGAAPAGTAARLVRGDARYPQLHEAVGAEEYVEMKQREARPAPSG